MSRVAPAILCGLLAAVPPSVDAADDDESERPLVIISGPRASAFDSRVDLTGFSETIETREAWRGYETVGDVLERSVGVRVRSLGGEDDFATVSVRGSTPAQVLILVDGVSYTRASDAVVDVSDLPLDAIDTIEVYRGFVPARFAGSGASSVVNITTRAATRRSFGASLGYGSFESAKATVFASSPSPAGLASGAFSYRRTDGDFEYRNDNGTPFNPNDDFTTDRRNNASESFDLVARLAHDFAGGSRLTLVDQAFYKDEGTPGVVTQEADEASFRQTRNVVLADWTADDRGLGLHADFTYLDQVQRDPLDATNRLGLPFPEADGRTYATTGSGRWSRAAGSYHLLELSAETGFERYEGRFPGNPDVEQNEDRTTVSLAAGDEIFMPGLELSVAPQARGELVWNRFDGECAGLIPDCDSGSSNDQTASFRLGARWEPHPRLTVKGNIASYVRQPTFQELFGISGFSLPNPNLEPETGVNRDIGFIVGAPRLGLVRSLTVEYAFFFNTADDQILLVSTGTQIPRATNIGKSRIIGNELRMALEGPAGLSCEANYTHQQGEDRSKVVNLRGNELPSLPEDEAYARLSLTRDRWTLSYQLDYQSAVFLDRFENPTTEVGAHTTHDLMLAIRFWQRRLELRLEADNVTDERFEDQYNFPRPGRSLFLTVSYGVD
jgi:iron complex outermembrane receptor protein